MKQKLICIFLTLLLWRSFCPAAIVGDWTFGRTVDGVAVTDGQLIPEGDTAGLFDASGNHHLGRASHYRGTTPPAKGTATIYTAYKLAPNDGYIHCALNTTYGGVYFPELSSKLKSGSFSVWLRFQPLNTDVSKPEIIAGRPGAWLICRNHGRLAAGIVRKGKLSEIDDIFQGEGPILKTGKWYNVGLSINSQTKANAEIKAYLSGKLIKEKTGKVIPYCDAAFQIGGQGINISFPASKFLYRRVLFYDNVIGLDDYKALEAGGGPKIDEPDNITETPPPTYWWTSESKIGKASNYRSLQWQPKFDVYCFAQNQASISNEVENDFYLKHRRKLFTTEFSPGRGYFGPAWRKHLRCPIMSYTMPDGCNHKHLWLDGYIYLHANDDKAAVNSELNVFAYSENRLLRKQAIAGKKDAVALAVNLESVKAGEHIYIVFQPAKFGKENKFWFDYKLNFTTTHSTAIAPTVPVTTAFHVSTEQPFSPDSGWMYLHYKFCDYAQQHPINLLFIGDSITAAWDIKGRGKEVWNDRLLRYQPANFGIAGQTTQDVLWRIAHDELKNLHPKAVVIMLGCNDINWPADEIAAGVTEVVRQVRVRLPDSVIILMGILPRGEQPDTSMRLKILKANDQLSRLADGKHIHYVYFGDKLLSPDGSLSHNMSPDSIHPSSRGYIYWANAIQPVLDGIFQNPNAAANK